MKYNINSKYALVALVIVSLYCAFYLQSQTIDASPEVNIQFVNSTVHEGAYLPDVKFIKEILKNIFNVLRA